MRYLMTAAVLLVTVAFDAGTGAHAAKWCARYKDGSTNCGFWTRQQCQESISGAGGFCDRNPQWRERDRGRH
jgi:Protein of unknown function (DUF3551)